MYFKMLAIEASPRAGVPEGLVFRWTAHHVKEIYTELLPQNFELDGSQKIQLTCGPRGDEPVYHQVLGTSNLYMEDFDFSDYAAAALDAREETVLRVIERGLGEIAKRCGKDPGPLAETAAAVRAAGFRMAIETKKLTLREDGKQIVVVRNLSRDEGECWSTRVLDRGRGVLGERPLSKCPHFLDMRGVFKAFVLEGDLLVVRNRFGKTVASVSLAGLLGAGVSS